MKRYVRKFSFLVIAALIFSSCSPKGKLDDNDGQLGVNYDEIVKPEKITLMSHTFSKDEEALKEIMKQYKENTGIELIVNQISDNNYYEFVNVALAADNQTDLIELGSVYYPSAAMYDLIWDMSDIFEQSEIKDKINNYYVDALRIDGHLYGFPLAKGNGTMTYVRKDWMEQLNISAPKNFDEYYEMLKKFKTLGDDIIPLTAAGLINSESPYRTYLPEFYQDANPDIYYKDGEYVDGMVEPNMRDALKRMNQAYNDGVFDSDITKNKTSDCRNKLYDGKVAVFNYWSGNWAKTLQTNVTEKQGEGALIEPIAPIKEIKYIERPPVALVIPKTCENPEGVFKYFLEYSHDAGEGELLFSIGIEGRNYEVKNGTYDPIKLGAFYTPELTIANNPLPINIDEKITDASALFDANSRIEVLPAISKGSGSVLPELSVIRKETIEAITTGEMTIDEGLTDYEKRTSKMVKRAIEDLNETMIPDSEQNDETKGE